MARYMSGSTVSSESTKATYSPRARSSPALRARPSPRFSWWSTRTFSGKRLAYSSQIWGDWSVLPSSTNMISSSSSVWASRDSTARSR